MVRLRGTVLHSGGVLLFSSIWTERCLVFLAERRYTHSCSCFRIWDLDISQILPSHTYLLAVLDALLHQYWQPVCMLMNQTSSTLPVLKGYLGPNHWLAPLGACPERSLCRTYPQFIQTSDRLRLPLASELLACSSSPQPKRRIQQRQSLVCFCSHIPR